MQTVLECQASQAVLGSRASKRFQARNADRLRARILGVSRSSRKALPVCASAEKQVGCERSAFYCSLLSWTTECVFHHFLSMKNVCYLFHTNLL